MTPTPIITQEEATALLMHKLHLQWPGTRWKSHLNRSNGALDLEWVGGPLEMSVAATAWHYEAIGLDADTGSSYEKFFWWDRAQGMKYACSTWPSMPLVATTGSYDVLVKSELAMVHLSRHHTEEEIRRVIAYAKSRWARDFNTHFETGLDDSGAPYIKGLNPTAIALLDPLLHPQHIDVDIAAIYAEATL